jgi:restriction system protein
VHVLAKILGTLNTYAKWVFRNIDEGSDLYIKTREDLVKVVEEAIEEASYDDKGDVYSDDMNPVEYENMCADILSENGWVTRITSASGDQGVDVFAEKDGRSVVLQCKKYTSPVGNKAVQEAHAGRGFMGASAAAVVTNTSYTQSAKQLASTLGVLLLHHDELADISSKL